MISPALAKVLAENREDFNLRTAEARRRHPTLDLEAFASFIQTGVDPLVTAFTGPEDRIFPAAKEIFDIALELSGHGLVGPKARSQNLNQVFRDLLPRYAGLVLQNPKETLGALVNGALYLETFPGAKQGEWLELMSLCAGDIRDISTLKALGQAAAWRAGLAHFRQGALEAGDLLAESVIQKVFGTPSGIHWPDLKKKWTANPWWDPVPSNPDQGTPFQEIGAFTGFGGSFSVPPKVVGVSGGFMVASEDRYFFLAADRFGAVLHAATQKEFAETPRLTVDPGQISVRDGFLIVGSRKTPLSLSLDGLQIAVNEHTVALASPLSFSIWLGPLHSQP